MRRHNGPRQGWHWKLLRRIGFDRNPMRRGTDRIQAVTRAGLLVVFLAGAPVAAQYVSHGIYVSGLQAGHAEATTWHRVPAVVLHAAPIAAGWSHSRKSPALLSVRWASPDGSPATGEITVAEHAVAGSIITVWIDEKGHLTQPPLARAEVSTEVMCAAIATLVGFALLLAAVGGVGVILAGQASAGALGGGLVGGRTAVGRQAVNAPGKSFHTTPGARSQTARSASR
jgi:hypothetical protein